MTIRTSSLVAALLSCISCQQAPNGTPTAAEAPPPRVDAQANAGVVAGAPVVANAGAVAGAPVVANAGAAAGAPVVANAVTGAPAAADAVAGAPVAAEVVAGAPAAADAVTRAPAAAEVVAGAPAAAEAVVGASAGAAAAAEATVLFVHDKDDVLVPLACAIAGVLETDAAKCLAPVPVDGEVLTGMWRNMPERYRAKILSRVTTTKCGAPVPGLKVTPSKHMGTFPIWPPTRLEAARFLADHEPTDPETDEVLAVLPAEARRVAKDNLSRYDPLMAGLVDLDGDRVDETIYTVNVASKFLAREEGLPDEYVFHGIVVRWGGSKRVELALTFEDLISVREATDLDSDGRAELLLSEVRTYQLARVGGGALRRVGAPRCAY